MCGRYHVENDEDTLELQEIIDEINRKYSGTEQLATMKTGEVFPTDLAPIIGVTGPALMKWGFPMQGKSQAIINARCETAHERPMFKDALMTRRIVIPTTGFYEWTHEGKKAKDKFLFRLPGEAMLYLAGLFMAFEMPTGKEIRFTILTTEANEAMRPYHHRMPICVGHAERDIWISDAQATMDMLRRPQPQLMATRTNAPGPVQTSLF